MAQDSSKFNRSGAMATQHQRRQSMPIPIATHPINPTIITTPPSASTSNSTGFSRFNFKRRSQNPGMLLPGGSEDYELTFLDRFQGWVDKLVVLVPRSRRQLRYLLLILLGLYVVISLLVSQNMRTVMTIARWKYDNWDMNANLRRCQYRKEPMLFVDDSRRVLLIWEMNCNKTDLSVAWSASVEESVLIESTPGAHEAPVQIQFLDSSHFVYTAKLDDLPTHNTPVTYTIRPIRREGHYLRSYTFQHWARPPSLADREVLRIGAISDNQCEVKQFMKVLRKMREHSPVDYLIHAGDAVQDHDSLDNWQTDFWAPLTHFKIGQQTPILYTHGNHDYDAKGAYPYTGKRTWHAYTLSGIRFIVLDSNLDVPEQDDWLKRELQSPESREAWFRVVLVHISPYTQYWEKEAWFNKEEQRWGSFVRERYVDLFKQYGVDLVISGHQHNYMRGQDDHTVYTIIGGAGGTLDKEQVEDYSVWEQGKVRFRHHYVLIKLTGDRRLIWEAYDADCGSLMDAFVINSRA
ncbi:hypothetical protein DFQ27_002323 [Actinomortierella ambigua]|uniref:Calcineurin-like phosphoesterase domain-containing protein n=1 Tax=Actinomortierella ambigua TaxID=1343610 RepID=A0A9P6U6C6_9FUNG|nr:hypothetical protein DFQ27_002323 [Actinomortierella ambigua]